VSVPLLNLYFSTITSASDPTSSTSPGDGDAILTSLHGLLKRKCSATPSSSVLIHRPKLEAKPRASYDAMGRPTGSGLCTLATHPRAHTSRHKMSLGRAHSPRLTSIKPLSTPIHSQFLCAALQTVAVHSPTSPPNLLPFAPRPLRFLSFITGALAVRSQGFSFVSAASFVPSLILSSLTYLVPPELTESRVRPQALDIR
jgi:hypothetical protein